MSIMVVSASHHSTIPANGNVMLSRDNAVVIVPTWLPSSLDVIGDQVSTCAISRMKTCAADAQQLYFELATERNSGNIGPTHPDNRIEKLDVHVSDLANDQKHSASSK